MRLRDVLFPEGGKVRNFLRDSNIKIKTVIYGKAPSDTKEATYWKIMERLEPKPKELKFEQTVNFKIAPKISIVILTNEAIEKNKKDLIKSVKKQTYSNIEIYETNEIKIDKILEKTKGDYITIVKANDILARFCMYEFVAYINEYPKIDIIYSDEDTFVKNLQNRRNPSFKPDFSIDMLESNNYIGNIVIYKRDLVKEIKEATNQYDLILKATEKTNKIGHIAKVLYHKREKEKQENSSLFEKNRLKAEKEKKIIKEHLNRIGRPAEVKDTQEAGIYDIKYEIKGNPKVTILIPNKDEKETLQTCVKSILKKSTYSNYEIVIIENNSTTKEIFEYYKKLEQNEKIRILYYPEKEFNYSKIINYGVKNTLGEYIIQLNNDTEIITSDWIEKMLGYCQREDVGAVGARLYYSDMSLQHGGVVLGLGGVAGHRFLYLPKTEHAHNKLEAKISNVTAVTGACMMAKRKTYEEIKYMNEDLAVAFNDVDFCLKIRKKDLLIVYNPYVELLHYESKSRGKEDSPEKQQRFSDEIDKFMSKWSKDVAKGDPYYNWHLLIPEIEIEENNIQSTI